MNTYRFVPKCFGWGFVPISWEGWLITFLLVVLCLGSAFFHGLGSDSTSVIAIVGVILDIVVYVVLFSLIALPKTKGVVKWRGGTTPN